MKHYKFILLAIFSISVLSITAQNAPTPLINSTLSGKIIDLQSGLPLANSSVKIKGTTHEVIADEKGFFQFKTGQKLPYLLVISFVGYETKEIVASTPFITISLKPKHQLQDEVVVVGYGKQTKRYVSSAITSINAEAIKDIPATNLNQLLQGQASGILASANTSVPGSSVFLRVRGSTSINATNDPLYVIDGVFINNRSLQTVTTGGQQTSPLADINPADIESIEVLKDANATAIYGSRGANGVILITTKHGKLNSRTKVNLGYYKAYSEARKFWPVLTGPEEAALQNETWLNDGKPFASRPFRPKAEGGLGLPEEQNTYDRIGLIFQNAPTDNVDLSVSGGDEKTTFYIGGNYLKQEAIVKPDFFQRASAKINLEHQLNKRVKIGTSINGIATKRNMSPNNNVPWGAVNGALYTPTYFPIFNEDGSYNRPSLFENPVAAINEIKFTDIGQRFIGNVFGEIAIAKNWKLKSSWSIDINDSKVDNYYNSKMQQGQTPINGSATSAYNKNATLINEQILTYTPFINANNQLTVLAGNTIQKETYENTTLNGTGFPTDQFTRITSAAIQTGSSSFSEAGLLSFFSRITYTLNKKYSIDANFRADASSRFGKSNQWGYFPATGFSWRLSEEKFVQKIKFISDLKLRISYGSTGNQNGIPDFASKGLWSGGNTYLNIAGISPVQIANPNLKWETTKQLNVGFDASLFDGKINLDFNYYQKNTTDLLLELPVPSQLGYSFIFANAGAISNKGVEFSIKAAPFTRKNFCWVTNFSISTNQNKVEQLATPILKSGGQGIIQQGQPLYSFYLHKQTGVNPLNGDVLFEDLNKDGRVSDADLQILGNAWAKFFGGFSNDFTLFNHFDIKTFIYYSIGNKVWNNTRYRMGHGGTRNGVFAMLKEQLNRWQKPGDITDVPRLTATGNNASIIPSRFLEDGSFLRLRTISVGYNFPKSTLQKVGIQHLRIYAMATNLFTITKYKGVDPEVNTVATDQNILGYDQAIASQPKTIQIGINLTL